MKKSCLYFFKYFAAVLQCAAVLAWIPVSSVPAQEDISVKSGIVCSGNEDGKEGEPGITPQNDSEAFLEIPN